MGLGGMMGAAALRPTLTQASPKVATPAV